jgi:outer membrane protein OmpA-like peptidoglycan-associated protein
MRKMLWIVILSSFMVETSFAERLFGKDISQRFKDLDKDGVIAIRDKCPNTPPNSKVDNFGCSIAKHLSNSIEKKVKLDVRFETSKHQLKDSELKGILKLGKFLQEFKTTDVVIEGHTDSQGDEVKNLVLSQNRANAIKQALVEKFTIAPNRIKAIGYGESQPIADNQTENGRATNRRVTAEVSHINVKELKLTEKRWTIYTVDSTEFNSLNI